MHPMWERACSRWRPQGQAQTARQPPMDWTENKSAHKKPSSAPHDKPPPPPARHSGSGPAQSAQARYWSANGDTCARATHLPAVRPLATPAPPDAFASPHRLSANPPVRRECLRHQSTSRADTTCRHTRPTAVYPPHGVRESHSASRCFVTAPHGAIPDNRLADKGCRPAGNSLSRIGEKNDSSAPMARSKSRLAP